MQAAIALMNLPSGPVVRVYSSLENYRDTPVRAASPKNPIKFAVGSPGRRSGLWRIWSPKDKADVYVQPQSNESLVKVSLHESGDWRCQVLFEKFDSADIRLVNLPDESSRIIDQWAQHQPFADGWTGALTVVVPSADVVDIPGDTIKKIQTICWTAEPPWGKAAEFRITLIEKDMSALIFDWPSLDRLSVVGAYRVVTGATVVVTHHRIEQADMVVQALARVRAEQYAGLPSTFSTVPGTGPRTVASARLSDGYRIYYDLALTGPPTGSQLRFTPDAGT
ncbi:hypothetical protein [Rhodococcoides kroppenstedtii]|uniref:hypothetical protein n=1 Tax=Rhodococcoides kroppenstedtii TaxID=293050 RepID=UPI001427E661|nr:hypothetical protein [Rhodococcus kroppenstedtii]NIL81991.1 hypothetical protein [Rhodococcus kroppenstedtii]